MKTTMIAGVCLLALVLTFTIAECGPSQDKRQAGCTTDSNLQNCITKVEQITSQTTSDNAFCNECRDELIDFAERCTPGAVQGYRDTFNRICSNESSGATAIAGSTIFITISALLVYL